MVMSNELSTPKILILPSDSLHCAPATNFSRILSIARYSKPPAAQAASADSGYFVSGDAAEADPQ